MRSFSRVWRRSWALVRRISWCWTMIRWESRGRALIWRVGRHYRSWLIWRISRYCWPMISWWVGSWPRSVGNGNGWTRRTGRRTDVVIWGLEWNRVTVWLLVCIFRWNIILNTGSSLFSWLVIVIAEIWGRNPFLLGWAADKLAGWIERILIWFETQCEWIRWNWCSRETRTETVVTTGTGITNGILRLVGR